MFYGHPRKNSTDIVEEGTMTGLNQPCDKMFYYEGTITYPHAPIL